MPSDERRYARHGSIVLGYHGTEASIANDLVLQKIAHLKKSDGQNEWLGHGIYFWEGDPERALDWARNGHAKAPISEPAVVGAIIDLGVCLDLTTNAGCLEVQEGHEMLVSSYAASGIDMPVNKEDGRRELDCVVIQAIHKYRETHQRVAYDTVRGLFQEGQPLYPGAGFSRWNHAQIAVRSTACIRGYFLPLKAP